MCGTVGLFAGCPAVSFCPKQLFGSATAFGDSRTEDTEDIGIDTFATWDERASVRTVGRRTILEGDEITRFFPPSLVPVASHPLVSELPRTALDRLLTSHAYRYLDFTEQLETLVINRVVGGIARGAFGVRVSDETRLNAMRIYTDEAYHALVSADLIMQLERVTGQPPRLGAHPLFLSDLEALCQSHESSMRPLIELLFVVVSETLITGTLAVGQVDHDVDPTIADAVRDHARDEGRHHVFFADYLNCLWGTLTAAERALAGRIVPDLIGAFLRPEVSLIRADLRDAGLSADDADEVLHDTFELRRLATFHERAATRTLAYFDALGAFDSSQAADARARLLGGALVG